MSSLVPPFADATDATDATDVTESTAATQATNAADVGDAPPSPRTRFLEVSRRYLLESALPAPREPAWAPAREAVRPWLSSRAARRLPAWPVASAPWGRR